MSKQTFPYLCNRVRPSIEKRSTCLRQPISVEKQVAITLWYLATPMEYRSIGHLFGVARTAFVFVHEMCTAIVDVLRKAYISFPKSDKVKQVVDGFQRTWGVPQCCGAIDGCHIPISAPAMNHTNYYNWKGFYSVVTQAVVDFQYRFLEVYIGWPAAGSVHDTRLLHIPPCTNWV